MESLPVYTDFQSLAALRGPTALSGEKALSGLKALSGENSLGEAERLEEVAEQFASVFTHMMLKSMRDASLGEGIFDSDQSLFYRDMFDQQLALSLSQGDGVGISSMLSEQLRNATGISAPEQMPTVNGRRASAAYAGVQSMTSAQDRALPADTGVSRNELQRESANQITLPWRGQTPR